MNQGTASLTNVTISGNSNVGLFNLGDATLTDDSISGNSGSGFLDDGAYATANFVNSTISKNDGTGFDNAGSGNVTFTNATISGNSGAGINNQGNQLSLTYSTISGNSGPGVYNAGTAMLADVTISANQCGGVTNVGGTLTLTNDTISGNSANINFDFGPSTGQTYGGGILNDAGTLTLTSDTVASNSADIGGGVYTRWQPVTLDNTIVALNAGGDLAANSAGFTGNNDLIGDGSSLGSLASSLSGSPLLSPRWAIMAGRPRPWPCCPVVRPLTPGPLRSRARPSPPRTNAGCPERAPSTSARSRARDSRS